MTNQRCPVCGRPHVPGACPTSGAGSGAPRSILGAAAVPPTSADIADPGLALLADAGLLGVAERYAALRRVDRTHAEALYSALIEMVTRDALITPIRDDAASPWAGDGELDRDNAPVWEEATREVPADLDAGLGATINSRIATRYDELMLEGKHGHYETMFRVVAEETALATALTRSEPAAPKPEPTGPAPWMAPRGECRSCDRRRDSVKLAKKKAPKP